tara:strand:+ start:2097 stop:2447 length:351 start_codon:yes stop_codon:yes gene_type:complete
MDKNVFGQDLQVCNSEKVTGWTRSGKCEYKEGDGGNHLVCANMTEDFLKYTKSQGNDLITPSGSFPGLKEGDNWCICAGRMSQAISDNHAPNVVWEATNERAKHWPLVNALLNPPE